MGVTCLPCLPASVEPSMVTVPSGSPALNAMVFSPRAERRQGALRTLNVVPDLQPFQAGAFPFQHDCAADNCSGAGRTCRCRSSAGPTSPTVATSRQSSPLLSLSNNRTLPAAPVAASDLDLAGQIHVAAWAFRYRNDPGVPRPQDAWPGRDDLRPATRCSPPPTRRSGTSRRPAARHTPAVRCRLARRSRSP